MDINERLRRMQEHHTDDKQPVPIPGLVLSAANSTMPVKSKLIDVWIYHELIHSEEIDHLAGWLQAFHKGYSVMYYRSRA